MGGESEPELLHYYCSSRVFISLIENRQFWLTSLTQSNDRAEGLRMRDYWWHIARLETDDDWATVGKVVFDQVLKEHFALGVCFSEAPDLLSQWRGYADDGRGICVSFDFLKLKKLISELSELDSIRLCKVAYVSNDRTKPNEIMISATDALKAAVTDKTIDGGNLSSIHLSSSGGEFERIVDAVSRFYEVKNEAFYEEREWRIYVFGTLSKNHNVGFRDVSGRISPYVKLPFSLSCISKVTLGPNNSTPLQVIEELFKRNKVKAKIGRSAATYTER